MKILFLDYDGVLNKISEKYSTPVIVIDEVMTMAEPELVYRLNLIVDRADVEIVLSSSWRHAPDWRIAMRNSGIVHKILDRTPRYCSWKKYGLSCEMDLVRGHNIQDWLDEHPEVEKYAIVDDASDFLDSQKPNLFETDPAEGLTQEVADSIEAHLS